ncbi:MAG TPA: hypothetical protein VNH15_03870 [Elusimicrobiota bacterium]|nr:hypothetical protein [Elusimicrobiota bacterium]
MILPALIAVIFSVQPSRAAPLSCNAAYAPLSGRPLSLQSTPDSAADSGAPFRGDAPPKIQGYLKFLCWNFDAKAKEFKSSGGRALSAAQYRRFLAPYNLLDTPVSDIIQSDLYAEKCRFQPSGEVLCVDSDGHKLPLTNLNMLVLLKNISTMESYQALGHIRALLSNADPNKPLDPATLKKIEMESYNVSGIRRLPPSLSAILSLRTIGDMRGALDQTLEQMNEKFDGETPLSSYAHALAYPLNHSGTWAAPKKYTPYFDQAEQAVGRAAQSAIADVLSQNPVGREILDHFRGPNGRLNLPKILIGSASNFSGGYYSPGKNYILLNQKDIIDSLPVTEQSKLKPLAGNPGALNQALNSWLGSHPNGLGNFVAQNDVTFAHELTHAWQDRRIPVGGRAPGDGLDWEYEAFTWQNRYLMADIAAHPRTSLDSPDRIGRIHRLMGMLADYNDFRRDIAWQYASSAGVGAESFPTALETVEQERKSALSLAYGALKKNLRSLARKETLKAQDLRETARSLRAFHDDYDRRAQKFEDVELPRMRRQAARIFPAVAEDMASRALKSSDFKASFRDIDTASLMAQTARINGASDAAERYVGSAAGALSNGYLEAAGKSRAPDQKAAALFYAVLYASYANSAQRSAVDKSVAALFPAIESDQARGKKDAEALSILQYMKQDIDNGLVADPALLDELEKEFPRLGIQSR